MDQYLAINKIRDMLSDVIKLTNDENIYDKLITIDKELNYFLDKGIDFKEIIDNLDDSIFITDSNGTVLYVNPAYTKNTGITSDEVLNYDVNYLINTKKLYTGGCILEVIKTKKSTFNLATTYKTNPPLIGYAMGTPIFNNEGELHQVVACSRPIISLRAMNNDFNKFLKEVNYLNKKTINKESDKNLSENMIGKYTSLSNIWTLIDRVAATDATVLITGESGCGKEVVADEIFINSNRTESPFIKINCASIPSHLLESELFGYEKGAFSGANTNGKPGLFELANNGTLMLDEIGDMPMDLQVKLLRAIQSQEITRIGGIKPLKVNIRFIALTNCNLKEKIEKGLFRQDLYYRLNVIPIYVPPLRERIDDLEDLCIHFINKFTKKYNCQFSLTNNQLTYMKSYKWPGNIRELENVIEYLVLCSSGTGSIEDMVLTRLLNISYQNEPIIKELDFNSAVATFEKQLLEEVLVTSKNLRDAGEKLNINASTISRKIKQYGISYPNKISN